MLYDGDELFAEYSAPATGSPVLLRQYGHGSGSDDPVYWIEAGLPGPSRFLHANHQGSIVAVSESPGTAFAINAYDEWGVPAATNQGRFQYTGQAWIPELGLYYYKARIYSPTLGRFMQTDPIGYEDQVNLYAYVGNDPGNAVDPTGEDAADIVVTGGRLVAGCARNALACGTGVVGGALIYSALVYASRSNDRIVNGRPQFFHPPPPSRKDDADPKDEDLDKVKGNRAADKAAQEEDFDDAHDAKKGRGESEVDIYKDRKTGKHWLWDGVKGSEKDPL